MKAAFKKYRLLIIIVIISIITFFINQFPLFVEQYYSTGLYPYISRVCRFLLGWIPFSVGDLLYIITFIYIVLKIINFIKKWRKKQLNKLLLLRYGRKIFQICLIVYISFNWLWGFNYSRLGSAYQMQLKLDHYSNSQLVQLTDTLIVKLNELTKDSSVSKIFDKPQALANESMTAYQTAAIEFPFLRYQNRCVKSQIFYSGGSYMGIIGYLNPFTLEAQLNTTVPTLLLPYVTCHEMAHQLGYASESEANFIAYIACKQSREAAFRYSVYFDLFSYTINDLYYRDSAMAIEKLKTLSEKIKNDRKIVKGFFNKFKNPLNPAIDWIYDKYLKLNSQPKGRESYNEVVGWLIAYANEYGWNKI